MPKKLSKQELLNMIKESVSKKVKMLTEDIYVEDNDVWDYYDNNNDEQSYFHLV